MTGSLEINQEVITELEAMARNIRQDIIEMIYAVQSGHPGGSLSATDIVTALYFYFMRVNPENPNWEQRDRFVLSKGHACPVWYSALAEKGFFLKEELLTLRKINSRLQGHPVMGKPPGIDVTTGSLGQGLSLGVGMAMGLKLDGGDSRVYALISDGELNEGQIWEAAMAAAKFNLDNLIVILDYNNLQLDGWCNDVMPIEPIADKWRAFNWEVFEMNGHDMREIIQTIEIAQSIEGKPSIIIAHTIKGKGVSYMENRCEWHGQSPNDKQYEQAMRELRSNK